MFDIIPNAIASLLTVLFPVFASYKALRTSDPAQLSPWLMYWVSYGLFTVFEAYTYWLLGWVPLYGTVRLIFLLYLVLPQTQGARLAYQQYIHPFLAHHEAQIEDYIGQAHERLNAVGLGYLTQLIELIKRNLLGMHGQTPSQRQIQQREQAGAGVTYAQSLLSRFNLPTAREGLAAPAGDFYGLLASATGMLGRSAGSSPAQQARELSERGALIPSHVRTPSDKVNFVNAQREKLQVLLQALDREAGESERELSRNRSEVSFDRIEEDEADADEDVSRQREGGGGGWFGWGSAGSAGNEQRKEREQGKSTGHDLAY